MSECTPRKGVQQQLPPAKPILHCLPPNGSRSSCGRLARRRKGVGRSPCPARGHNTPLPLERSAPASFKRLLGGATSPPTPSTNPHVASTTPFRRNNPGLLRGPVAVRQGGR